MWSIFLPTAFLVSANLLVLSSYAPHIFRTNLFWVSAAIVLALVLQITDWRAVLSHRWLTRVLYLVSIFLLVAVFFFPSVRHVHSWISIGSFGFQPVELAKIALVFFLAEYFSRRHLAVAQSRNILTSFAIAAVPTFLTLVQPALGSAIILFFVWYSFLVWSGLPIKRILVVTLIVLLAAVGLWLYGLKDFQRGRITAFLKPEQDLLGVNYNVNQSKIAIGSAGFWGKGFGQGSQTQLGFLPEPESDFTLAAWTEEWGLLGGLLVVGAFSFLEIALVRVGLRAKENFEKFLVLGTVATLGIQFFLNSGSATGLLPVVGVPFPFLSYGGSSLLANTFLVSVVAAISKHE